MLQSITGLLVWLEKTVHYFYYVLIYLRLGFFMFYKEEISLNVEIKKYNVMNHLMT